MTTKTKQVLLGAIASCNTCGAETHARNGLAWAHNHVRHNPEHKVNLALEYYVRATGVPRTD